MVAVVAPAVAAAESVTVEGEVIVAIVVPAAIPGPPTSIPTTSPVKLATEVTAALPLVTMPEKDIVPGSLGSTSMGSDARKVSVVPVAAVAVAFCDRVTTPNCPTATVSIVGIVTVSVGTTVVTVMVWSDKAVRVSAVVVTRAAPMIWGPAAALGNWDIVMEFVDALTAVIIVPEGMLVPLIGCPAVRGLVVVVKTDAGDIDEMVSSLTVTVPVKVCRVDTTVEPVAGADSVMV
jgi:hypothetical protein